ncbi:hypothetical protein ACB092_11G010200 [Castanea dentata]
MAMLMSVCFTIHIKIILLHHSLNLHGCSLPLPLTPSSLLPAYRTQTHRQKQRKNSNSQSKTTGTLFHFTNFSLPY